MSKFMRMFAEKTQKSFKNSFNPFLKDSLNQT